MSRDAANPATALPMIVAQSEMRPRERLIWADRPVRGAGWRQAAPGLLFGLLFAGFALFWMAAAFGITRAGGGWGEIDPMAYWFPFFGLPFFVVGIAVAIAPLVAARRERVAVYALSNERIVVIGGGRRKHVRSVDLADMGDLERIEREDGSGDVIFRGSGLGAGNLRALRARTGLYGIASVRRVADQIERARRAAREESIASTERSEPAAPDQG
jgi:hypothetical protein